MKKTKERKNIQGKGNKALSRAAKTVDNYRVVNDVPLITDETVLITPEKARKILEQNKNNRPINWRKVDEIKKLMVEGKWKFHAQGIILDDKGNLLTGQKRLYAIIHCGIPQYMRVSRGSPSDTANVIDRGQAQTAVDLAARKTDRKHSPMERNICRGLLALEGNTRPNADDMAMALIAYDQELQIIIEGMRRIKKTRSIQMILAVFCKNISGSVNLNGDILDKLSQVDFVAKQFERRIEPDTPDDVWNRGAKFKKAMATASEVVRDYF